MRLAYIANGTNIHVQRWVNFFARNGHEVHLICWQAMAGYDENIHVHLLTKLCPRIWALSQYPSFLFWIFQARQLTKKIKPDIVDGHYVTIYGLLAACTGFHPLVVTAMGSDILIDPKQNFLLRNLVRYALKKADTVVCNSETVKRGLLELGISAEKIRLVYNGIDTKQFRPQLKDENIKSKLDVGRAPLIVSIRNLRPVYNVGMLIKAVPLVLRQFPEAKFIIGGDGEQRDYLKSLASSLGVSDAIRFTGYIAHDELPRYLASSDVYVSTSLSDSTSLSLQEAMACELAPVVTDLPANREWITDGVSGFLVPTNDVQALADRIVYLLKNDEARRRFGRLGRQIIRARAEYQREMEKMAGVYEELITIKR